MTSFLSTVLAAGAGCGRRRARLERLADLASCLVFCLGLLSWGLCAVAAEEEDGPAVDSMADPFQALREGAYEDAVEAFRKWARAEPGAAAAFRGWAQALAAQGKYGEALRVLEKAGDREASPELLCAAGRIHLREGDLAGAERAFRAAAGTEDAPVAWKVQALNRLGQTLWKQGLQKEARAAWQRVVDLYEEMSYEDAEALDAEAFVEMGLALVGLNRYQEAHDVMFAQAKEKDETCPAALLESARALMDKYNYPDSRFELRDALDENPYFADALALLADNLLADFQRGAKRYALVEKYAERALAVNPNHAQARIVRGSLWLSDGDTERAAGDFRKAVALDPSCLRARGLLAACLYLQGREDALHAEEKAALAVNPRGAEFYHVLGVAIEKKFRYADCVAYCEKALQVDPDYWPAYAPLAINCLRTGREKRGREMLEKSWQHDKFNVWVYNTRLLLKHMDANYRELKTDRFTFKFPRQDYEVLATYLVPLMEDAYDRLAAHYGVTLYPRIDVEEFSQHKWFSARTVGLEGLAASGACFGRLVTLTTARALPQNWGAVSWHEFAHVVTLALSRQRVPRWLTEGCSVFEEGRDHPLWARNFDRQIADAYGSGRLLPLAELDFGFSKPKYPNQVLISYFQGCLIVRYIREKWGFDAVRKIVAGYGENKSTAALFREVLSLSLQEFDKGFFGYVDDFVRSSGYQPALAQECVPRLELAVKAAPKDLGNLVDLAWAYHCNGVHVDVPLTVQKILALDPDNADAPAILGLEYLVKKKNDKARENLEKALAGGTKFRFRVHSALAALALKKDDKELAIEHLEKAEAASPRAGAAFPPRGNTYYKLAALYEQVKQPEKALEQWEKQSRIVPDDPRCRKAIIEYCSGKDDDGSARKVFQALGELLFIDPYDVKTHQKLAALADRLGEGAVAIREYEFLLKGPHADRKTAYAALARAYAAGGNTERAMEYARKLQEAYPGSDEAKRLMKQLKELKERNDG